MINLRQVQESPKVKAFLKQADDNFMAIGYKEHGFRHANLAADIARNVLTHLGYSGERKRACRHRRLSARYREYHRKE